MKLPFVLYFLLLCLLAVASFGQEWMYTAPPVVGLWVAMVVASILWMWRRRLHKRWTVCLLHVALIVILSGALLTHLFGQQGRLHLREQSLPLSSFENEQQEQVSLPFGLLLESFQVDCYPGTQAPMDYASHVLICRAEDTIRGVASMNHPLLYQGYRFYQSGYDADAKGTILSVSYDPCGLAVTYTGYALLLIAIVLLSWKKWRRYLLLLGLFCLPWSSFANEARWPTQPPKEVAEAFGRLYVYHNGRICPMQTLARDFCLKIYGNTHYHHLSAEEVLVSWLFNYDEWKNQAFIKIKGKETRALLGIEGSYACLNDFVDASGYKLDGHLADLHRASHLAADEKFQLISTLCTGSQLKLYPFRTENGQLNWYSWTETLPKEMPEDQWRFVRRSMAYVAELLQFEQSEEAVRVLEKIRLYQQQQASGEGLPSERLFSCERLYHSLAQTRLLAMLATAIGLFMLLFFLLWLGKTWRLPNALVRFSGGWVLLLWSYLTILIVLRAVVTHHWPLSNGFETMQFLAWTSLGCGWLIQKRLPLMLPFSCLLCGLSLLVSMMGESNPQLTQLTPVLVSPWLSVHVAVIMLSYTLLALLALNGLTAIVFALSHSMFRRTAIERLHHMGKVLLYPAVMSLAIGIFVGAVWANQSWGRYWGWDPKEVWALVTLMLYALALHTESLPFFRRPMVFHVFCVLAFCCVLFTYFGVNFFLGGMHSYA